MKKIIFLSLLLLSLFSCENNNQEVINTKKEELITVINCIDRSYMDTVYTTTTSNGNEVSHTIGGATIGHLLLGGWMGALVGGAIGSSTSDNTTTSTTKKNIIKVSQYTIQLSNYTSFLSTIPYEIGCKISK